MSTKGNILKKNLIEALEKSLGVVTSACKSVNCSRKTFYQYYKEDERFAKEVDNVEGIALDFAESQLHKQIKDGNPASTIFYLKTKGKKRGYVERTEIEHLSALPITGVRIEEDGDNKQTSAKTD